MPFQDELGPMGQSKITDAPQYIPADAYQNLEQFVPPQATPVVQPQAMQIPAATQISYKDIPIGTQELAGAAAMGMSEAGKIRQQALGEQQKYETERARLEADALKQAREENEKLQLDFQAKQEEYRKQINNAESNMIAAKNDYANSKIDSMRVFKGDNSNRVLAAISLSLGALGSALTGQRNYAFDMINGIIDRDIEEQKYEAQKKYSIYENAKKEQDILTAKFDNDVQRMMIAKNIRLDVINKKLDETLASAKTPKIRENILNLQAQLKESQAANLMQFYQVAQQAAPQVTTTLASAAPKAQITKQEQDENMMFSQTKKTVKELFDQGARIKFTEGMTPSALGGKATEAENITSAIGGVLAEKLKQRSDADWQNIVKPLTPRPGDTPKTLQTKWENLNSLLNGYAPAGYVKLNLQQPAYVPSSYKKVE